MESKKQQVDMFGNLKIKLYIKPKKQMKYE